MPPCQKKKILYLCLRFHLPHISKTQFCFLYIWFLGFRYHFSFWVLTVSLGLLLYFVRWGSHERPCSHQPQLSPCSSHSWLGSQAWKEPSHTLQRNQSNNQTISTLLLLVFDSVCALLLFEMFDLCRLNVRFQRMMGLWLPMLDLECNMTMLVAQWKAESVTILRLSSFFVFFSINEMIVHVDIYNACWSYFDLGFWALGFGQVQFFYLFKINVRLQVVVWTICFVIWNFFFFFLGGKGV